MEPAWFTSADLVGGVRVVLTPHDAVGRGM